MYKTLLASFVFLALGCSDGAIRSSADESSEQNLKMSVDVKQSTLHFFHEGARFDDVTRAMPGNSIDHVYYDSAPGEHDVVVVSVTCPSTQGVEFVTQFTGPDDFALESKWSPAAGSTDDEHQAIFVVPAIATEATTVIQQSIELTIE